MPEQILWIGDGAPAEAPAAARVDRRGWPGDPFPDADLIVLSGRPPDGELPALRNDAAPVALVADGLDEKQLRRLFNRYPVFRVLEKGQPLGPVLTEAIERRRERRERDAVLADFSRRNRELEGLTERLEAAVAERTGTLEESTREEKDKLARERQLIRFLSETSTMNATEEILRVLRRELRRFHRVQSLIVAVGEAGKATRFYCSQGDRVLHADGPDDLSNASGDERQLRQILANRFGRPFNKLMVLPLEIRPPGQGLVGVEYSLLGDDEVREIGEILGERARATGMAVERLSLEDRLRRFAIRWERTFDGFRDPIAVIDTGMHLLRGNRSFASTVAGRRKCHEIFAGRAEPCEGCPVAADPASPHDLDGTVKIGRRTYRLRSWPVHEEGTDKVSGRVTSYDDITEARELSLRMLQNEKMSAIGELAGHIAHELNNPLTGIRSLAQVLMKEWTQPPLSEDLGHIENAARRCQTIIRHLLEFTRGGEGETVPVRADEVVEMTLPLLKTALRRHRQEIMLAAGQAKVLVDVHLLQQVIFNLVNNACQAHKEPGRVGVATRVVKEGARELVEIRVIDDGPGIPPEIRARLFEPFVTSKKEGEGTGLGLSTSKAIVERFGGTIDCRSEPGKGAEFVVRFPRKADA